MRVLLAALAPMALLGCTAAGEPDPEAACQAQGHAPDTEEWRVCMDAGGVAIATGPGSSYANVDEAED